MTQMQEVHKVKLISQGTVIVRWLPSKPQTQQTNGRNSATHLKALCWFTEDASPVSQFNRATCLQPLTTVPA